MKIRIEAESQEEFELKKATLLEKIAGPQYEVRLKKKGQTTAGEPRPAHYQAQHEMMEYWGKRWEQVLKDIKDEVRDVLHQK